MSGYLATWETYRSYDHDKISAQPTHSTAHAPLQGYLFHQSRGVMERGIVIEDGGSQRATALLMPHKSSATLPRVLPAYETRTTNMSDAIHIVEVHTC